MRSVLFLSVLVFCSCSNNDAPDRPDLGPSDGGVNGKADGPGDAAHVADLEADLTIDVGQDPDAALDGGTAVEPTLDGWYAFTTTTGEVFEGQLVAVYDSSLWWNPGPGLLYAVFDPDEFAPYPNDRSFQFVWEPDIASVREIAAGQPAYREFLRQNQIVFQQPPLDQTNYVITGNTSYHLEEDGFGDFAWDVERTNDAGEWFTGLGASNEDFFVWDERVYSGVAGEVIEVVDTGVDNMPGSHPPIGTAVNNLVGIALGGHFYAYYLHFREGGVDPAVVVGERIDVGDPLGRVGNSGVSLEPHMHVVLLWFDVDAGRSYSVPAEFQNVAIAPSPTGPFTEHPYAVPQSEEWVRRSEP